MRMAPTGELQTLNGYPILDVGGTAMLLDANAGPPRIARDGTVTQANRQVGAIGLFNIDGRANLRRFENSGVIPDQPATAVVDFTRTGMQQGYRRERQRQCGDGDVAAHQRHPCIRNGLGFACRVGSVAAGGH